MVYGFNQQFNQQQNPYLYQQGYNQPYGAQQQGYPAQGQQGFQQMPYQNMPQGMPQNPYQGVPQGGPNFGINPGYPANNNGQNFTAVDTEKLKQDAVELSGKAADKVEENSPFSMLKNMMGIDFKNHPKRTAISLALTLATVVGLAALGNSKFSTKTIVNLGHNVDDILKNSKIYTSVAGFFSGAKSGITSFLRKSKTIDNIFNTLKNNSARPKWQIAQGQGQGARRIFKMTPPDVVKTALDFADDAAKPGTLDTLKKLAGSTTAADDLYEFIKTATNNENGDVCKRLTDVIAKNFGCMDASGNINKKNLNVILNQIKNGTIKGLDGSLNIDVSELTGVVMDSGFSKAKGPVGKILSALGGTQTAWWPTNAINKVIDVLHLPVRHIGRGNLGDALIKYNVITGQMADTAVGRLVQKSVVLPTECISNFVNDKSGAGVMISLMALPGMFNNIQEAPKEQKVATAADSLISSVGSFTITMPLAFGTTYGLASLANMATRKEGGGLLAGPLRTIGKFFGMGLDPIKNGVAVPKALPFKSAILNAPVQLFRKAKGLGGGALRFILITAVFSALYMGPIRKIVNKIFGKPYSIDEEKTKAAQEEAQKAQQAQLEAALTKIQAHPEILQAIQSDPKIAAAIQKDPTILIQLAASIPDVPAQPRPGAFTPSPILQNYINNQNNAMQQPQMQQNPYQQPQQYQQPQAQQNPYYQPQQPGMTNPYGQQQYSPVQPNMANPGMTNPYQYNGQQPQQYQTQPQYNNQPQNPQTQAAPAPAQNAIKEPPRSYIPSSKPFNALSGDDQNQQKAQAAGEQITNPNVQSMLLKADKAEQAAMRYL